jgi:hypothetical protein
MTLRVGFRDLERLAQTDIFADHRFALARNQNMDYVLSFSSPVGRLIIPEDAASDPELAGVFKALTAGFLVNLRITVPGKVIETNAARTEGNAAIWTFDADEDPAVLEKIGGYVFNLVFDGQAANLKEFGRDSAKKGAQTPEK